jgi:hypothetical protein
MCPCVFRQVFSIQNKQGGMKTTLAHKPTSLTGWAQIARRRGPAFWLRVTITANLVHHLGQPGAIFFHG